MKWHQKKVTDNSKNIITFQVKHERYDLDTSDSCENQLTTKETNKKYHATMKQRNTRQCERGI